METINRKGRNLLLGGCWVAVFMVMLGLQWARGAWASDLGGDPDEAAHAVTALMIRDYLVEMPGVSPLVFAETYYQRYPKVALGHYPPAYYLLATVLLLGKPSVIMLFVLQAALTASVAVLMVWFGLRFISVAGTLLATAGWCAVAPVQKLQVLVMADIFLLLGCLASAGCFLIYMERRTAFWSVSFGALAALSILTKGSGWMLALLPALAVFLAKDWRLPFRSSFWLAPLPVLLGAFPWQWFSLRYSQEGMSGLSPWGHLLEAAPFYTEAMLDNFGLPVAALLVAAAAVFGWKWGRVKANINRTEAVLWAFVAASTLVLLSIPVGLSSRYLILPSAAVFLLVVRLLEWGCRGLGVPAPWRIVAVTVVVSASVGAGVSNKELRKEVWGYADLVRKVKNEAEATGWRMMICSDPRGEGSMVAAAAFDAEIRQMKDFRMPRASKELASIDWLGRGKETVFADDEALLKHLTKLGVGWVALDFSVAEELRPAYYAQLEKALDHSAGAWKTWGEFEVRRSQKKNGTVRVYKRHGEEGGNGR